MTEIQKELLALKDQSIFAEAIRMGAETDLIGTIKMIISKARDNRSLVSKIIGEPLLKKIESL